MCFSLEASIAMFVLGSLSTIIASKKMNNKVTLFLAYFTIMQAIHIVGYLTINDCNNIYNKMASYANYTHIAFQPLFNLIGILGLMQFTGNIDKKSSIKMNYALKLAFLIGIFLFIRMFNITFMPGKTKKIQTKKNTSCMWCGKACSFQGEKHINFSLPLLYPTYTIPSVFAHFFAIFIIPFFISKFAAFWSILFAITTYIPAYIHGIDGSEAATIWCFTSVAQYILIIVLALFYKK